MKSEKRHSWASHVAGRQAPYGKSCAIDLFWPIISEQTYEWIHEMG